MAPNHHEALELNQDSDQINDFQTIFCPSGVVRGQSRRHRVSRDFPVSFASPGRTRGQSVRGGGKCSVGAKAPSLLEPSWTPKLI